LDKSVLLWIFLNVTKAKVFGLDTYYYIKPIYKLEIPTKWTQINGTNFFVFLTFK